MRERMVPNLMAFAQNTPLSVRQETDVEAAYEERGRYIVFYKQVQQERRGLGVTVIERES